MYYYCITNGTGSTTAKSNVSGAVNVENATLTISGTTSICVGDAITLSANSTAAGSTFTWSTSDNTSTISVSPLSTTSYTFSGTSPLGCLNISAPVTVTVNTLPTISAANGTICEGNSFVFTPSGAVSYTFSSGSATVSPTLSDSYIISGTSAEGCVGSNSLISVTVNTLPIVSTTGTNALCEGSSATLTANGATSYTWNSGSNATSISVNPTITSSYSLSGTSSEGCVSPVQATAELTVHALPLVSITGTNEACAGTSVNLTANGASTYTWSNSATTAVISVTPSSTSGYSVVGTSVEGCLSASFAATTVSVNALPIISISSATTEICVGSAAGYTASGATTYTWNTGSNASNISITPTSNTSYSVSGTNSLGCVSAIQASPTLTVYALPTLTISGNTSICAAGGTSIILSGSFTYSINGVQQNAMTGVSPSIYICQYQYQYLCQYVSISISISIFANIYVSISISICQYQYHETAHCGYF